MNPRYTRLIAIGLAAVLFGPIAQTHADDCKKVGPSNRYICGKVFNRSDQSMLVFGNGKSCHLPAGRTSSARLCGFRDVDKFTFPKSKFRVCFGRFCWRGHVFKPGQWYTIHGNPHVLCDHPKKRYPRCRIVAGVIVID
jgi:hypothetical protein